MRIVPTPAESEAGVEPVPGKPRGPLVQITICQDLAAAGEDDGRFAGSATGVDTGIRDGLLKGRDRPAADRWARIRCPPRSPATT